VEVPSDRGQGDIDDRGVESHDQQAHRANEQDADPPLTAQI
jgi:hypothetical protein